MTSGEPSHGPTRRAVGMFDSGFGGLTVARALIDLLPHENLVYVGDTARYPFGPKPMDEVRDYALQIADWLVAEHDIKALVVACNTAAAAALEELSARFDIPVFGVIEPGIASLLEVSETGQVGVIGTVGTIGSGAYQNAVAAADETTMLTCAACPGFVEFVERGELDSDQVRVLAERLLAPVIDAKVDSLLLGCTHYPFLARTIGDVMGRDVVLVSSADETAFRVREVLIDTGLTAPTDGALGTHTWVSSGDVDWFAEMGRTLLGPELSNVQLVQW